MLIFFYTKTEGYPQWSFNGDVDNPTFNPSLLNRDNQGHVCHLFVRNGKIEYLGDCTHSLAGKVIDMEDMYK